MIYLDNAATTPLKPEVLDAMMPYLTGFYGNPSSIYRLGAKSKDAVERARHTIAEFLNARDNEIYFTGGGSESDNWALKAVFEGCRDKGNHIITTKIEHHAILHTAEYLEKEGCEVTYLDVDENGFVDPEELRRAIRPTTILISVMFANNEIGTIQPIKEIGEIAREHGILFHTDAVQAYGHVPIDVEECHIDLLSASAHKINGPKGIGIMYLRNTVKIGPFIHGGAQERNRRAGTHNVAGIVGFGKATELAAQTMQARREAEERLRDYMINRIETEIPYVILNGDRKRRLPNNVNFCFRFVQGDTILIMLDMKDIYVSSGSACASGSIDPSHVLLALGRDRDVAYGALRMTISDEITREDADRVIDELKQIVARLRGMSPAYAAFQRGRMRNPRH